VTGKAITLFQFAVLVGLNPTCLDSAVSPGTHTPE